MSRFSQCTCLPLPEPVDDNCPLHGEDRQRPMAALPGGAEIPIPRHQLPHRAMPIAPRGPGADPLDRHVGAQLKRHRILSGLSQEKIGDALGVTFQQVQKYERGANRIGAGRLYRLAVFLNVPITAFYDGLAEQGLAPATTEAAADPSQSRETLELVRNYHRIDNPVVRRRIHKLVRSLASTYQGPDAEAEPAPFRGAGI